jgi:hypothetical protein
MKQPFSEEILSAYIDGELPAQERAAVERWLEESLEAREKLDGFRRLSGLFADLPRNEVPPEFPTNVLQLAERRMLLPEARPVQPRQSLRHWALAGGSSIAAALILGLMLHAYLPEKPAPLQAGRFDDLGRPAGSSPVIADRSRRALNEGEIEDLAPAVAGNKLSPWRVPLATDQPPAGPAAPASAEDILDHDSPESAIGRSARAKARTGRSTFAGSVGSLAAISPAQQEQIEKAMDVIGKTPEDDDLVAVVKFQVVDRAEGLVLLQDAFADSQILVESEQVSEEGRSEGKVAAKSAAAATAGNEALYVVAEPDQLRAAIATILAREKFALGLEIGDPIEIAALDDVSQKRVQQVDRELISDVAGNKPTAPDDAKKSADAQPAPERAKSDDKPSPETAAPALAGKKSLSKVQPAAREPQKPAEPKQKDDASRTPDLKAPVPADKEAIELAASQSRQTVVNLPLDGGNQRSRTGGTGKESLSSKSASRNSQQARGLKKELAPRDKDGDNDERAHALMRVLIVVEESAK